jgi:hypothetical protein
MRLSGISSINDSQRKNPCIDTPHGNTMDANERSNTMGDKGGKKDKDKDQKQKIAKKGQQDKIKQEKQPKKP